MVCCAGSTLALDRRADQIAPLGPRTVVVLHVLESEQVFQHEPRVAGALPDAAVRDHRLVSGDPLRRVQSLQLLRTLERAIVVARLRPGNVLRPRDVTTTLARLGQSRRREN